MAVFDQITLPELRWMLETTKRYSNSSGVVLARSSLTIGVGLFFEVFSAETTNTWSPNTIGVAVPSPVKLVTHLILVWLFHRSGGFEVVLATPSDVGPRQFGQWLSTLANATEWMQQKTAMLLGMYFRLLAMYFIMVMLFWSRFC